MIQTNQVEDESNKSESEREYCEIYDLLKSRNPCLSIDVKVNSCKVRMEVDTGAYASIINMEMHQEIHQEIKYKSNKLMSINSQMENV